MTLSARIVSSIKIARRFASVMASTMQATLTLRPSEERGFADHGCKHTVSRHVNHLSLVQGLKTYHSFSFASYQDPSHEQWGPLRVINEDRVEPNKGFGEHGHREFEIFSIILGGELEHKDSLGGLEIMKRSDVQLTSTGKGVRHAEFNRNASQQVHFLQCWAVPNASGLKPAYYVCHFFHMCTFLIF